MISSDKETPNILSIENLSVDYGPQYGLKNFNLTVKKGEIHAVVGIHGSGKTTLINVISGIIQKSSGSLLFNGQFLDKHSPENAQKLGIFTLHQQMNIFPGMSAYKNIFLNRELKKHPFLMDKKRMKALADEALKMLALNINPDVPLMFYNKAIQQMVEIAKIVCFPSKLLLVDDISGRLSPEELEKFQHILSIIRERGTTILYTTSNLNEVSNFANYITVLENGENKITYNISEISKLQLVKLTYTSLHSRKDLESTNIELFYLKNFYENLLNNLNIPILVTDTKGKIILINSRLANLLEIKKSDFVDHSILELLNISKEDYYKVFHSKNPELLINISNIKVGRNILIHINPFYDEDRSFIGAIFLFEQTNENMLTQSMGSQNRLNSTTSIKEITAGLSHEINNPLGIILNYLQLIKSSVSIKSVKKNVRLIENEVLRIKHILQKQSRGDKRIDYSKSLKLNDILLETEKLISPTIKSKNIDFMVNIEDDISLTLDKDLLKQVLLNLIINGIEAMPEGGKLTINCLKYNKNNNGYALIEVIDTGTGIKKEEMERIFEPFYSTKHDKSNRGLGLSLSKDIIKQMGGHIELESKIGYGSTFKIFLPIR